MTDVLARVQRWHDTDHGSCEDGGYSSCYCCCERCNPDYNPARPNPFWVEARAELRRQASQ